MGSFQYTGVFGILSSIILIITAVAAAAADNNTSSEQHLKMVFDPNLDVQNGVLTGERYKAFLSSLRGMLAGGKHTNIDMGAKGKISVDILPPDDEKTTFDLILTGVGEKTTTLRFRKGNLYLVGYEKTEPANERKWLEFGDKNKKPKPKQWIPDSEFLGFGGDYGALEGQAGMAVTAIQFSTHTLEAAVKTLATTPFPLSEDAKKKKKEREERGKALIVMIQMFAEAARFAVLSDNFANILGTTTTYQVDSEMFNNEKNWGTFSEILLCKDKFPKTYKQESDDEIIKLGKTLAILLNVQVDKKMCKIRKARPPPEAIDFQAQVQNPVEPAVFEA